MKGEIGLNVVIVSKNKKDFLSLLLLADEQENMIDKYLQRGVLFALYDDDLKSVCVVTDEGNGIFELQSLATYPQFREKGYGRYLINYACAYYKGQGARMLVGTGDVPAILRFYEKSGFEFSHRVENYFPEFYEKPIFADGVRLTDKVYLKRDL